MDRKILILIALALAGACEDEENAPRAPGGGSGGSSAGTGSIKPPPVHDAGARDASGLDSGLDCNEGANADETLGLDNADVWPAQSELSWERSTCPTPSMLIEVSTACGGGASLQISLDSEAIESSQIVLGSRALDAADPYVRLRLTKSDSSAIWTLCETASGILTFDALGVETGDELRGTLVATLLDCSNSALPTAVQVSFDTTVIESPVIFCAN